MEIVTKITFKNHTGIILDNGESIKDNITKLIYKNVLFWIDNIEKNKKLLNKIKTT